MVICGMHVHAGVEDDDLRADLMGQMAYFLPHLLALSTSSPFWQGQDTGMMSYRISVWDELPRTGIPERCESWSEYCRIVAGLQDAAVIEDATKIWWDLRPSSRYPTLEMRICDLPTLLADTVGIAALYLCILRMLYRLRRANQRWRVYPRTFINENRWRAQRYGIDETLIDFGIGRQVPYAELMDELLELVAEDVEALDCTREICRDSEIFSTGARAPIASGLRSRPQGRGGPAPEEAIAEVVQLLIVDTAADI